MCFDLDGVLIDSMPLHAAAWQETFRRIGFSVTRRDIYEWEGEPGRVTARTVLSNGGLSPSARLITKLLREKERRFSRLAHSLEADPQLAALLPRLSEHRIPTALVTGTSRRELRTLLPRTILARFHTIITGDQVRRGKPHPEPYQRAFRQLGVAPRQAIVVENAPYGIRSAARARAGIVVALASSLPRRFLHEADLIVGSTRPLCRQIARLLQLPQAR